MPRRGVGCLLPDAVGSLRRGSTARKAGPAGFGAGICWRRTPRCCSALCGAEVPPAKRVSPALARGYVGGVLPDAVKLSAARKSRLTFRQAGAAGMAEPCRPGRRASAGGKNADSPLYGNGPRRENPSLCAALPRPQAGGSFPAIKAGREPHAGRERLSPALVWCRVGS